MQKPENLLKILPQVLVLLTIRASGLAMDFLSIPLSRLTLLQPYSPL